MKVRIQVGGIFHAFSVANALEREGHLDSIITNYPRWKIRRRRHNIPWSKIESIPLPLFLEMGIKKMLWFGRNKSLIYLCSRMFDLLASNRIGAPDIFLGWPTFSLYSIRKSKSRKIITVLDADHLSSRTFYDPEFKEVSFENITLKKVLQKEILDREYEDYAGIREIVDRNTVKLEWMEYLECDYILTPTRYVYETFLSQGIDEKKLINIPYGVDIGSFNSEINKVQKHNNKFKIIFGGAVSFRKGIQYLLKAYKELKLPNSELILFGGIEECTKPFLSKHRGLFTYIGKVPHDKLAGVFNSGTVFVLPSVLEGFGIVLGEAMASGLPVIASEHTGAVEMVRDGIDGFIVPIRDVEAIKEKILYLYENLDISREMGRSAKTRIKENFTWQNYASRMVKEFSKILEREKTC